MIALHDQVGGAKARIKIVNPSIDTREEAEQAMADLASWANHKRQWAASLDAEILALREQYQPDLARCDHQIAALGARLEIWAGAHPEAFPRNRKSMALLMGVIGFRLDTPSLVLENRSVTWPKVLAAILRNKWRKFTRLKLEVDKEAILARAGTLQKPTRFQREVLPQLGLKIAQAENFYVEPALTEIEPGPRKTPGPSRANYNAPKVCAAP